MPSARGDRLRLASSAPPTVRSTPDAPNESVPGRQVRVRIVRIPQAVSFGPAIGEDQPPAAGRELNNRCRFPESRSKPADFGIVALARRRVLVWISRAEG